jgi:hypothetical protein
VDPVSLTKLLSEYGLTAIIALLIAALLLLAKELRGMFSKFEASQQARIDDGKLYAGALKDAAKAIEKSNETSVDLAAEVSRLKLLVEHSRGVK